METQTSKNSNPWPWIAGACGMLVLFACGLFTLISTGTVLLISQKTADHRPRVVQEVATEKMTPTQAKLQDVRGVVEARSEDGDWQSVQTGDLLTAGQRVRTGNLSGATLAFYDGSLATLMANAELSIDELDAPKNAVRSIVMTQWSGESEHDVAQNKREGSRYNVKTPSGTGEAKGTVFQVVVTPAQTAYYYVLEGAVAVSSLNVNVTVNAGQVTSILFGQPPLEPVMYVSGEGVVSQTGETWIINDQEFKVNAETTLVGDPKIGDWAMVKGRILEDNTKVADWIVLVRSTPANRFNLTGIVETIGETEWKINGQGIAITPATETDAGIVTGDTVRVEGLVLAGGKLEASEIEKVDEALGQPFEFAGIVTGMDTSTWVISGTTVVIDNKTSLPETIEIGQMVQVEGYLQEDEKGLTRWLAVRIILLEDTEGSFSFTGKLEDMDPWKVAGISFETREWTEIEEGLEAGDLVRVEGKIDENGVWIATEIEKFDDAVSSLVLIGTVFSIDPWIVSGYPLTVTDVTQLEGEIKVGTLVRVEILIQADGAWQILSITALRSTGWFPGCVEIVATVISIDGSQVTLQDWPQQITLAENVQVEGTITPNSVIRFQACFNLDMSIRIVYIIIVDQIDVEIPDPIDEGDKVTICHKPGKKKGGNTITVSRSALGAHLGHGDYEGACR